MPGGQLPLRIFEPRYLDMVSECFRQSSHFGVCQIREGSEVGVAAMPYPNGTLVHIVDWDKGSDGLLNVLVEGQQKFSVQSMNVMTDDLLMGEVQLLAAENPCPLPDKYRVLGRLLERVFKQMRWDKQLSAPQFDDALWVGSRLLELLPVPGQRRQAMFVCGDPLDRLEGLSVYIRNTVGGLN